MYINGKIIHIETVPGEVDKYKGMVEGVNSNVIHLI
jgi:hypothetical protein